MKILKRLGWPRGQVRGRARRAGGALVLAALAAGLQSGCAHYQPAPLDRSGAAEKFAARRLSEPGLGEAVARLTTQPESAQPAPVWPPATWDRAQLLAVALTQNPQLAVSRAQVGAALAHEVTTGEHPNPDLTLQSEYARHDAHPWLYGMSLNWLLRSSERRRLDLEIARLDTGSAHLELMETTWAIRRDLAAALSAWEASRRRLTLIDSLSASEDRLLALESQRVSAGEDAPSELLVAKQNQLEIQQQRADQRAGAEAAQAATAKLLGVIPEALDDLKFTWPDWGDPAPVDGNTRNKLREQALLSRADIEISIDDYAVAEAKLKLAVVHQYPQFALGPGYYWDHGIAKFPFDVGFTLPLNHNRGEIAEARAAREIAGQKLLAQQADIYGSIAAAERAESLARASVVAADQQAQSARQTADHATLGLRLGATGTTEQLAAEVIATRAQLEAIQMRSQLQAARNNLEDVLHTPLSGPELALAPSWSMKAAAVSSSQAASATAAARSSAASLGAAAGSPTSGPRGRP